MNGAYGTEIKETLSRTSKIMSGRVSQLGTKIHKICVFNKKVKFVPLYGSKTGYVTKANYIKLQTFTNKCFYNES